MQVKTTIPDSLYTFALATVGSYPTRYDRILEEAFSRYKLMLGANQLRQIAGGGSNTTAQDAVDRFRTRIHKSISSRIDFGEAIPEEIASRMSSVMSDLWASCMKSSSMEFDQERQLINQSKSDAIKREQIIIIEFAEFKNKYALDVESLNNEITLLNASNSELSNNSNYLSKKIIDLDELSNKLKSNLASKDKELKDQVNLFTAFSLKSKQEAQASETEKEIIKRDFRFSISEIKREHEMAINRVVSERNQALSSESREKASHAETMISKAKIEQRLSQANENNAITLARLNEELEISKSTSNNLSIQIAQLNERIDHLLEDLRTQTNLASRSMDQLLLLQNSINSIEFNSKIKD